MNSPYKRRDPAQLEAEAEHRRQEDAAPRLRSELPRLVSMRLTFEDIRPDGGVNARPYVRPIVVASAPALFMIRCMEPRCNGRHDLTRPILDGLRKMQVSFSGRRDCDGMIGDMPCDHTIVYACEAEYRSS